ncbi:MAG: PhzF family phenazine biosynthesis protein [Chloroflexota bacterium]|nr:PhzF family phenazine biosynthesis protein [Chloroflexota bacterium]MDQ5866609.1 PhzF family phenazine biosynthesis protein [Chloroflexota bacterium]
MTRKLHYYIVDVFTDRQFGGNPLAVFTDGQGLSTEMMQRIAKEMNLSETTFVLPPEDPANHFKLRIFTPGKELPMAGHPTVGTSFMLARDRMFDWSGEAAELRLEEGVGPIPVRLEFQDGAPRMIWMTQPNPRFGPVLDDLATVAEMLSIGPGDINTDLPVEVVSCGVPFLYVPVRDLATMRRLRMREEVWSRLLEPMDVGEVFVFAPEVEYEGSTVHSRMFAPGMGITEDPATGGASGPLGSYLVRYGLVPADPTAYIVSEQGIEMGRPSFIHIQITRDGEEIVRVQVGGQAVYMGEGDIELAD